VRMVDVSEKAVTTRTAVAQGFVKMKPAVVRAVRRLRNPKGNPLEVARIAGIQAAKRTSELIPLCHPLLVGAVNLNFTIGDDHVEVESQVETVDRTGVEMEALTAVAVAGLALIDMVKAIDPAAVITDVRVEWKEGGKTGPWHR